MIRAWQTAARVAAGVLAAAVYALPQTYTISARPGVVNYIEGSASIDDRPITEKVAGKTFLNANDTLTTGNGKAEVLLTPGVFLRVGADSEIRMISPSLTKTSVEVTKGEIFVEANELAKDNDIEILDHNATTKLLKPGLYRFSASDTPVAGVIIGKAEVSLGERTVSLGKDHQTVLDAELKPEKFDAKKQDGADDLYAWSKVRDEYAAASSYASARTALASGYYGNGGYGSGLAGAGLYSYGYNGYGPGWAWNPMWSSYAWLPGEGAFFSPFGYGFFSPGVIGYAPVTYISVAGRPVPVAVNAAHPPVVTTAVGARPTSHPPIYSASGMTYRGNGPVVGSGAVGHVSTRSIAAAASSGRSSGGSSGSSSGGAGYSGAGAARSSGSSGMGHAVSGGRR